MVRRLRVQKPQSGVVDTPMGRSLAYPPPPLLHAMAGVTHRKRGSEGTKSTRAGSEESKHCEGLAGLSDAVKYAGEDVVCLHVSAFWPVLMTHVFFVCSRPQNVIFILH